MSWVFDYTRLGHSVFIAFIELKIDGGWEKHEVTDLHQTVHEVMAASSENCMVHVIEPDGLRRILQFTKGGTIAIHQNVLSYHPEQVNEITIDEKEQSGKGSSRDKL